LFFSLACSPPQKAIHHHVNTFVVRAAQYGRALLHIQHTRAHDSSPYLHFGQCDAQRCHRLFVLPPIERLHAGIASLWPLPTSSHATYANLLTSTAPHFPSSQPAQLAFFQTDERRAQRTHKHLPWSLPPGTAAATHPVLPRAAPMYDHPIRTPHTNTPTTTHTTTVPPLRTCSFTPTRKHALVCR